MKKTVYANLGGYPITFDEDAYQTLKKYLDDLSAGLSSDYTEIMPDIEARLAEMFKNNMNSQVVDINMVDQAIKAMGKAEEFGEFKEKKREGSYHSHSHSHSTYRPTQAKKLYRNTSNALLGGVCSGIADYFDVDPTLVRVLWILLFLAGGLGFIGYLILWIIIPRKPKYEEYFNMKI